MHNSVLPGPGEPGWNKRIFTTYAGRNTLRWKEVIGQKVVHQKLGEGVIIHLYQSELELECYIFVEYNQTTQRYNVATFATDSEVLSITLPPETVARIEQPSETGVDVGQFDSALERQTEYRNHCWRCSSTISSARNNRCSRCYGFLCNRCGACLCS